MRKIFKVGLFSVVLSLCIGAGALLISNNQKETPSADATAQSITFTKTREVFMELSDDPTSGYSSNSSAWSTTAFSGARHTFDVVNGANAQIKVRFGETSASKKWHGEFVEYSYTFTNYAYSQTTITFNYSLLSSRDSTSGAADHVMEFIHEGYRSSTAASYTISCGADTAATPSSPTSTILGNPVAYRVNSNSAGTTSVSNQTFTRTMTNTTASDSQYTFYVAFFAYIESSSYSHAHTAEATLNMNIDTTNYDCSYVPTSSGTTTYGAFTSAWNAVNGDASGGSITLLRDVNVSSGFAAQKNVTLNLNGYSITRNGSGSHDDRYAAIFATVADTHATFVITNSNKSTGGYVSTNYATSAITIGKSSTVTVTNGAKIRNTYTVSGGGHVVVSNGGTLNVLSASLIGADSATSTTNTCVLLRQGASFYGSAAVITGGSYSIRSDDTTNKDYIYIGGVCNIERKIGIPVVSAVDFYLQYNNSTPLNPVVPLSIEFGTMPDPTTPFATCVNATSGVNLSTKLQIIGAPNYMMVAYNSMKFYYIYRSYTINLNLAHLNSSNTGAGTHQSNWTTTLTPSDSTIYAIPSYIMMSRGSTSLVAGTDFTYNSSTGVVTVFAETFVGNYNLSLTATAVLTTRGRVYQFIDDYMHMTDYTEELGYCKDSTHNYYGVAKQAFKNLDSEARTFFMENDNTKVVPARARFIAWAAANGEEIVYQTNDYIVRKNAVTPLSTVTNQNDYTLIIVVSAIVVTAIACGALLIIRKRKHN